MGCSLGTIVRTRPTYDVPGGGRGVRNSDSLGLSVTNLSRNGACSGASRYQTRVSGGARDVLVRLPVWISGNTRCTRGEERLF